MSRSMSLIIAAIALVAVIACAAPPASYEVIGSLDEIAVGDGGVIRWRAEEPASGGALSAPISLRGADAAMVLLRIEHAPAYGLTLAMLDARKGHTVGYWQNVTPLEAPAEAAALLPLSDRAPQGRLFVGAHGRAGEAAARVHDMVALKRIVNYETVMYGSAVSSERWTGQSFTAQRGKLAGVKVRASLPDERTGTTPDLRVRLFKWNQNITRTRGGEPLATTVVAHELIPAGRPLGRDVDLLIPLRADTRAGEKYLIDFTVGEGEVDASQRYLLWCGPDGYDGGEQYIDAKNPGWDMNIAIYEEAR